MTWFEYAPEHAGAFDELVALLHSREERAYVDREVDIRLARERARLPGSSPGRAMVVPESL